MVREVLMKNRTRVWRNVYNLLMILKPNLINCCLNEVLSTICFANFRSKYFKICLLLFKKKPCPTRLFIHSKFFKHFMKFFVKKTTDFFIF